MTEHMTGGQKVQEPCGEGKKTITSVKRQVCEVQYRKMEEDKTQPSPYTILIPSVQFHSCTPAMCPNVTKLV